MLQLLSSIDRTEKPQIMHVSSVRVYSGHDVMVLPSAAVRHRRDHDCALFLSSVDLVDFASRMVCAPTA
jgi:hypothetical protein